MNWGAAHSGMLAGLAGIAIPVLIHWLNRRKVAVVDWGAMQFLEPGRRAQRRFELAELLLMAGRMALLAAVVLALTRPFLVRAQSSAIAAEGTLRDRGGPRRDAAIILDDSAEMGRRTGGGTARDRALSWSKNYVARLRPGDSAAVLLAKDRVQPLVSPASYDPAKIAAALDSVRPSRGSADLPAALAEAFRLLEDGSNPEREVVVLTDGSRASWRIDEPARWSVLRELYRDFARRTGIEPRIQVVDLGFGARPEAPNASVSPLRVSRGLIARDAPIEVVADVSNSGPGPLSRTAELRIDDRPVEGSSRSIGPISEGGKVSVRWRSSIAETGSHVVGVRLTEPEDSLPADDESSKTIDVVSTLPVLLIDGEPSLEPFSGEIDFLRAALSPAGAERLQVEAKVVSADAFGPDDLKDRRAVVLANVKNLDAARNAALVRFLERGGGVLIAPGCRSDEAGEDRPSHFPNGLDWPPAAIVDLKGDSRRRKAVARPSPRSFKGPALAPFAQGDDPPLARAELFAYRVLEPRKNASTIARLDTGDPWVVERPYRKGRVAMLAGPVDAEGGTLPVNPDFVPWAHEMIFWLAGAEDSSRTARPGDSLEVDLPANPPWNLSRLSAITPDGRTVPAEIVRIDGKAKARLATAIEPGIYRFRLADPPGGIAFAAVEASERRFDRRPLESGERAELTRGWRLAFLKGSADSDGKRLAEVGRVRQEIWRYLIFAALSGLCLEVWATRRLARGRGPIGSPNRDREEGGNS